MGCRPEAVDPSIHIMVFISRTAPFPISCLPPDLKTEIVSGHCRHDPPKAGSLRLNDGITHLNHLILFSQLWAMGVNACGWEEEERKGKIRSAPESIPCDRLEPTDDTV